MSPSRRNILVGLTVLGALLVLAWMVVEFGEKSAEVFAPPQMTVHFDAARADGLSNGSAVNYRGVAVGRVTKLNLKDDYSGVTIDALVNSKPPLPGHMRAEIKTTGLIGGGSAINLNTTSPSASLMTPDEVIPTDYVGLQLDLLPPQFANTAQEIGQMSDEIRKTAKELRESGFLRDLDATVKTINGQVGKAGGMLDSLQSLLNDPKMRDDLKTAIANIRSASGNLQKLSEDAGATLGDARTAINKTQGHVDDVAKQVGDRLEQVSVLMNSFQSIATKIDKAQGTAGMLVNDPKLYQGLVDTTRELNLTVEDLRRLIEQWEQEGVPLKLAK